MANDSRISATAKSILRFARRLVRRPRAFLIRALFRATPKRLHFLLFKVPWGICSAGGFVRVSLGEAGMTFTATPKIVGRLHGAEENSRNPIKIYRHPKGPPSGS